MGSIARVTPPVEKTGNMFRDSALGLVPETVEHIGALSRNAWLALNIRPALLELLRLRNARTVNCTICKAVRYDEARADGFSEDKANEIRDGYAEGTLTQREKLALAFADLYLRDPTALTPALAADLKREFSDRDLCQMAVALLAFNAASRTAVSIGGMPDHVPMIPMSVTKL